ncbi:hypothetical protein ACJ2_24690 [Pantoea sp. QMID2]|nr:hypothetical protein ACJ3_28280 [Pantoea sp. QMID3]GME58134.1 hypothetical protein ACJ2_24690 [Pantoea sp. QMID2]
MVPIEALIMPPPINRTSVFSGEVSAWRAEETNKAARERVGITFFEFIILIYSSDGTG